MPADSAAPLAQRLRTLAEKHGQAEIARRTGVSAQNVSRYLRGRKAPMEFGAALIKQLGVNPAWLMTGEGSPYLADVSTANTELAGDLLNVVNAMTAVSRMRLGELAGKENRKVVRELHEMLATHEKLRHQLHAHTRPLFAKLVDDFFEAATLGKLTRAREIEKVAAQAAQLCHDEELNLKLDVARATLEHFSGNLEYAASLQRSVFLRQLAKGIKEPGSLRAAFNFVMSLVGLRRMKEARALCHAVLWLIRGTEGISREHRYRFVALAGDLEVELGNLKRGLSFLAEACAVIDHVNFAQADAYLANALLLNGAIALEDALRRHHTSVAAGSLLLWWACWHEDGPQLRKVVNECLRADEPRRVPANLPIVGHARQMAGLPGPGRTGPLPQYQRASHDNSVIGRFTAGILHSQWARLAGDVATARAETLAADQLLSELPQGVTPRLAAQMMHWGNVLRLPPEKALEPLRKRARRFFEKHVARGYGVFAPFIRDRP